MYSEERDHSQGRDGNEFKSRVDNAFETYAYCEILNTVSLPDILLLSAS